MPSLGTVTVPSARRKQVLTKLSIKSTNQINVDRTLKVLPTIQKFLHIHQVPGLPFFHNHLHQIILKTPAGIFHLLSRTFFTFLHFTSLCTSRCKRRRKEWSFMNIGGTPESLHCVCVLRFLWRTKHWLQQRRHSCWSFGEGLREWGLMSSELESSYKHRLLGFKSEEE